MNDIAASIGYKGHLMPRLTSPLTILALAVALAVTPGLAGCKQKDKHATVDEQAMDKPGDRTLPNARPAEVAPATADLPAACTSYKTAIDKLAACESIPQASRDVLKQAYEQAAAAWARAPAADKAAISQACTQAVEAIEQTASACP